MDLHPPSPGETEAGGSSTLNQLSFPLHNLQYFPSNAKVLLLFLFQPWYGGAGIPTQHKYFTASTELCLTPGAELAVTPWGWSSASPRD